MGAITVREVCPPSGGAWGGTYADAGERQQQRVPVLVEGGAPSPDASGRQWQRYSQRACCCEWTSE